MTYSNSRFDAIVKNLKKSNHRLTPQRLAIAKILAESRDHPNVESIYEQLREDYPTMSLATAYQNIMLLKSLGEVLELGLPEGGNRYDGNNPYPHPHFICTRCKKIEDIDLNTQKDILQQAADATGFKILTYRLDFFGLCRECLEENRS